MKRLLRVGLMVAGLAAIFFGLGLAYVKIMAARTELPPLKGGDSSSIVYASDGKHVLGFLSSSTGGAHQPLDENQVSPLLRQAHMAAEDRGFYDHGPLSLIGTSRAVVTDIIAHSAQAGGSTITQQFVKNAYLTQEKTINRKRKEWIYAYKVEGDLSKDEILTKYVNSNYYGRRSYGIDEAARNWFGVSATKLRNMHDPLQVARATFLASLLNRPSDYDDYRGKPSRLIHQNEIVARQKYALDGLLQLHGVSERVPASVVAQAKQLLPLKVSNTMKASSNSAGSDPYLMQYVRSWLTAWQVQVAKDDGLDENAATKQGQATAEAMLARGGLKIVTGIQPKLQTRLDRAFKTELTRKGLAMGGIVMNPRDGTVVAMYGGRNFAKDQFNYAVYASRPPGSSIKPFVLADAVQHGISVKSEFAAPKYISGFGPKIWDHTHQDAPDCKLSLADAMAESQNPVFIELITGKMASCRNRSELATIKPNWPVTTADVAELIHKTGGDDSMVPGRDSKVKISEEARLAIGGTLELSPLKLAVMTSTLANGGVHHKPHLVNRIIAPDGSAVYEHKDQSERVLDENNTRIVAQVLTRVFTRGTAVNAQVSGHELAGKTGSTEVDDAWMLIFNPVSPEHPKLPAYAFAGWAGYTDNRGANPDLWGADVAMVGHDFFRGALAGTPQVDFPTADLNTGDTVGLAKNEVEQAPATTEPETPTFTPTEPTTQETTPSLEPTSSPTEPTATPTRLPRLRHRSTTSPEPEPTFRRPITD